MLLNEFVPEYEFSEIHSISVKRSPADVFSSLRSLLPADVPLVGLLMFVRSLAAWILERKRFSARDEEPFFDQMTRWGFVVLADDSPNEIVFGLVGRFWEPTGSICRKIDRPIDFFEFDEALWAKAGWSFRVEEVDGFSILRTETRVHATDPAARKRFARYWRFISPGSGIIRRAILRAAKKKAEAGRSP
ncbi:MAG TPA: hypothetical protein DCP63_12045 [Bacteroidetes bacterium]|nr:hypothetical protein [Bacteroidota bacterium]